MSRLLAALTLALSIGCTADVNELRLILPPEGALGLQCVDSSTGGLLLAERRRIVDGRAEISVSVDYLTFEGVPSCRPVQLLMWCQERGCPVVRRDCTDVVLEAPIPTELEAIQERVFAELRLLDPVTEDAPEGVVVIRMAVSNQSCDELGQAPHRCGDLLGCVYSCPVQLDEVRGDVLLELDSLGTTCDETIVGICAGIGFEGERCQP